MIIKNDLGTFFLYFCWGDEQKNVSSPKKLIKNIR